MVGPNLRAWIMSYNKNSKYSCSIRHPNGEKRELKRQLRIELWEEQKGLCAICNEIIPHPKFIEIGLNHKWKASLDHKGDPHDRSNLQVVHRDCNERKGSNLN